MIPTKLRLKNFIGIRSGLGRDEITLDLTDATEGAQLVALVGPNGTGKSTILDNLHPYRIMPSRAGSYSPGSFSYYDNIFGGEAVKELEFHHEGQHYRSTLVFKVGAKTKKTECYLHVLGTDGSWQPVKIPDGTVSDGKTETYDRCIEHILGTPEMFFTSVFAAQNRPSLSSYTPGEIKGLLSELLGLEQIRELGQKANEVAKVLRVRLDGMRDELARIEGLEAERVAVEKHLEDDTAAQEKAKVERKRLQGQVAAATKNLADAKAELGANAEIEERRARLQAQANGVRQRIAGTLRDIDGDMQRTKTNAANHTTALRNEITQLEGQRQAQQRQIRTNQALLDKKADIEAAAETLKALEAEESALIPEIEKKRGVAQQYRTLSTERAGIVEKLKASAQQGKALHTACMDLHGRAGLIDSVPCKGMELQERCQLLADANRAKSTIPAKEKELEQARAEYEKLQARGKEIDSALELMGDAEADLREAEQRKQTLHAKMREASQLVGQASALAQAEQSIAHANEQIRFLESSIAAKNDEIKRTEAECAEAVATLLARRSQAEDAAKAEIAGIEDELSRLPPPADTDRLGAAEIALEQAESALAKADMDYEQLNVRIATHRERLRQIEADLKNGGTVKAKAGTIEAEIAHWTTLAKALGNDGIIALSIDDAGPTLSGLANDLLMSCYGPRFSVSLRTQEQKASGDMKETFDIVVFDAERDDEKSVRAMSGGERIWINECITRAIALYQAQASGRRYGTLFADESDGALDPDRKQMFLNMKRKVLELGGYEREFFISHSPEVWEEADEIINMLDYKQAA